ncbi:4'-phosphopantetheinyl transferase superfamily protein [Cytophagales bacterium LB-30]|uniref:4'-phosphopantetheinyl transferase superfamily protein n=1 Tax=Shiella aurantiaca TaxID=3058365 RepID=A0ABT8F7P6_9BACT|nr:4'-phosphopantetheinyl transferase superfamily protein [Shiella aurantiaca]MDN4166513.1 4'-phosphopantetheinyl transferase superfamily protein [Shiella aurantiaca]
MPLQHILPIDSNSAWAFWHITESLDELRHLLGHEEWQQEYQQYKFEEKQKEWLAGRLCITALCTQHGIAMSHIEKDENGKPFLGGAPTVEISLSHAYPYAGAILHTSLPVGIDIEAPKEKMRRIIPRLCQESELEWAGNDLSRLSQLWSAKEVLYKIYAKRGLDFMRDLLIEFNEENIIGLINKHGEVQKYSLQFHTFDKHLICFNHY